MNENGLITIRSQSSVKATIDRLEASRRRADAIRLLCAAARLMAIPSNRVRTTDKAVKRLQSLTPRIICLVFANKRRRSGDAMMADCIRPTLAAALW
jgi:hypothetical protein